MLTSNLLTGSPSEGTGATVLWYLPGVSAFHFSCLEKKFKSLRVYFSFYGQDTNHPNWGDLFLEKYILKWYKLFFVTVCLLPSSHFLCRKHQCETSVAGMWRNVFAKSLGPCDTKTPPSMLSCSSAFCLFIYYSMGSSTRLCQTEYV